MQLFIGYKSKLKQYNTMQYNYDGWNNSSPGADPGEPGGIRTSRDLDISVLNIWDISVLGTGHLGTGNFGIGHLGTGNFGTGHLGTGNFGTE